MELLPGLYFARPSWLLLLIIVVLGSLIMSKKTSTRTTFEHFIDPKLLPFLTKTNKKHNIIKWFGISSALLAIIGLSGISWEKQVQPTYDTNTKTILLIDQSISLYSTDIKPNRLTRLKQKLRDLIDNVSDGEIAMVAFAGDAYTISPFSSDKSTITHFLLALDPLIMPLYGSNLYSGVETALSLLKNNESPAHLIIFTDHVTEQELISIPSIDGLTSIQVSIIGVGTQQGGEIVLPDGTLLRKDNRIVQPTLPIDRLSNLATELKGQYFDSQLSQSDVNQLTETQLNSQTRLQQSSSQSNLWVEKGHWLLMPLLIWLLVQFRPGAYLVIIMSLNSYSPQSTASPLEWFMTDDQIAQRRVDNQNWQEALERFEDKKWQAASNYALEKYAEAADMLKSQPQSANDFYNLGNSLAMSGQVEDAITAYEKALELNPESQETKDNLDYLKQKAQEQQAKEQEKNQEQQNQEQQQEESQKQKNNEEQNTQKEGQNKQNDSLDQQNDKTQENAKPDPKDQQDSKSDNKEQSEQGATQNKLTDEEQLALDQWLRQIQDDPGGLLKRKLWYLHQEKRAENRFKQKDGLPIW